MPILPKHLAVPAKQGQEEHFFNSDGWRTMFVGAAVVVNPPRCCWTKDMCDLSQGHEGPTQQDSLPPHCRKQLNKGLSWILVFLFGQADRKMIIRLHILRSLFYLEFAP